MKKFVGRPQARFKVSVKFYSPTAGASELTFSHPEFTSSVGIACRSIHEKRQYRAFGNRVLGKIFKSKGAESAEDIKKKCKIRA
jgi:hypothetical protein